MCSLAQSSPTLCDPMDCSLPGSFCPWDFPGKNTGVSCHFLFQGIFPIQGLNPHLLSPALEGWFFSTSTTWEAPNRGVGKIKKGSTNRLRRFNFFKRFIVRKERQALLFPCCCCSVAQSCLTLCDPMNCSMPGFSVLHHLQEFAQTHVH